MIRLTKLAVIGILSSAYLIIVFMGIKLGNNPAELDLNSVLAVSIFFLIFSIFVLVSDLKRKKNNQS